MMHDGRFITSEPYFYHAHDRPGVLITHLIIELVFSEDELLKNRSADQLVDLLALKADQAALLIQKLITSPSMMTEVLRVALEVQVQSERQL